VPSISTILKDEWGLNLSNFKIRRVLTEGLDQVWRSVRSFSEQTNSLRSKLLRQNFTKEFIPILAEGLTIGSYDESTFTSSTSRSYSYAPRGKATGRTFKKQHLPMHLLSCTMSDGETFFKLTTGTHN
jgi:hypothetical protein